MKKILILGSAPNAMIPSADFAYCANASASYFQEKLLDIPKVVSVVGEHYIAGTPDSEAPENVKEVRRLILDLKSEIVITEHQPWFNGWNLDTGLEDLKVKYRWITLSERRAITKRTSGLSEPIIPHTLLYEFIKINPFISIRNMNSLFRQHRRSMKRNSLEAHAVFRPSAGLIAAMTAMDHHGTDARYIFSGIGLSIWSDRLAHHRGPSQKGFHGFTHHIHADMKIFHSLRRKYNIEYIPPA